MMIVVMGVSGSGKSSVGRLLAARRDLPFLEGDDLHPPANVAKMAAGTPLDDADRAPWLAAIAGWMALQGEGVVACSALRRRYRDRLRAGSPGARFVVLAPSEEVLAARLGHRRGHFMPGSLLASQLATLELPAPDEDALIVTGDEPVADTVATALRWLDSGGDAHRFCA
jgi:gluconokinase